MDDKWWKENATGCPGLEDFRYEPIQYEKEMRLIFDKGVVEGGRAFCVSKKGTKSKLHTNTSGSSHVSGADQVDEGNCSDESCENVGAREEEPKIPAEKVKKQKKARITPSVQLLSDKIATFVDIVAQKNDLPFGEFNANEAPGARECLQLARSCGLVSGSDDFVLLGVVFESSTKREVFVGYEDEESRQKWIAMELTKLREAKV